MKKEGERGEGTPDNGSPAAAAAAAVRSPRRVPRRRRRRDAATDSAGGARQFARDTAAATASAAASCVATTAAVRREDAWRRSQSDGSMASPSTPTSPVRRISPRVAGQDDHYPRAPSVVCRDPREGAALSPPGARIWEAGAPSQFAYRKYVRRSFTCSSCSFWRSSRTSFTSSSSSRTSASRGRWSSSCAGLRWSRTAPLRTAVVGNLGLMGLNVFIAVRGVKIWHLLQRVGVENWIRTIASQLPRTRRVGPSCAWAPTAPCGHPAVPRAVCGGARARPRLREAAEAAARARAGPITKTPRAVSGSQAHRRFAEGKMRWALGWGGGGGVLRWRRCTHRRRQYLKEPWVVAGPARCALYRAAHGGRANVYVLGQCSVARRLRSLYRRT